MAITSLAPSFSTPASLPACSLNRHRQLEPLLLTSSSYLLATAILPQQRPERLTAPHQHQKSPKMQVPLLRLQCGVNSYEWGKRGHDSAAARFAAATPSSDLEIQSDKPYAEV